MPSKKQIDKALNSATISLSKHIQVMARAIELISEINIKRYTQKKYQAIVFEIGHEVHSLIDFDNEVNYYLLKKGGPKHEQKKH
jgi:hypothetical protein